MPQDTLGDFKNYLMRDLLKSVVLFNFYVMPPKFSLIRLTQAMTTKCLLVPLVAKMQHKFYLTFNCFFSSLTWVLVDLNA